MKKQSSPWPWLTTPARQARREAPAPVHGGVKLRMLKTGDGKELTDLRLPFSMSRAFILSNFSLARRVGAEAR